jgi:hypothetical protein
MRRFRLLAAVVACAALLSPIVSSGRAAVVDGTRGKVAGMNLRTSGNPVIPQLADLSRIRGLGINTLALDIWLVADNRFYSTPSAVPGMTVSDVDLATAIRQARANGMRTTLTLKLFIANPANEWRGYYTPSDPTTFFATWTGFVDKYADLAQREGAWMLFVGSEFDQAQRYEGGWRAVIADARRHFHGLLSYEANHPTLTRGNRVRFWDALDMIGVSAYFPLSNAERPTLDELKAGWHDSGGRDAFATLRDTSAWFKKPVIFGEAGYTATTYVGREPWSMNMHTYAPDLQAAAYQALLETFDGQPWWAGVLWWVWDRQHQHDSPMDKPAETLLRQWYHDGLRPGDASFVMGGSDASSRSLGAGLLVPAGR